MGWLELDNVRKDYSGETAVRNMNINVDDGEFIVFVGPSGCGKSTTLEIVAGLTHPTEGEVIIDGETVTDFPPKDRDIAMVFQNIALFPHMDVYDNICYGLRVRNFDEDRIEEQVQEVAKTLQVEELLDRKPDELSGGQQQRVAIGRAIARGPSVYLMDEPLANLDVKLRDHMRTEIKRLQNRLDITTIYVTHNQEEAMTMADRIVVMNDGEIQQIAAPLECYNHPANRFVAGFIGSPSMNLLDGTVQDNQFVSEHFDLTVELDENAVIADYGDITMGIRPNDTYVVDSSGNASVPSNSVETVIDVAEPLGESVLLYTYPVGDRSLDEIAQNPVLVNAEPNVAASEMEQLPIVFDLNEVHFFDRETGERVTRSDCPDSVHAKS